MIETRPSRLSYFPRWAALTGLTLALSAPALAVQDPNEAWAPLGTVRSMVTTTDQLVIKLKGRTPLSAVQTVIDSTLASYGLTLNSTASTGDGNTLLRLSRRIINADARRLARALKAVDARIRIARPDYWAVAQTAPNDPQYSNQWHYTETAGGINLEAAWTKSSGSGVVVAVLDTGYRPHTDLTANLVAGYDMIHDSTVGGDGDGRDSDATDPGNGCGTSTNVWHGTHVAGTIAATTNNGIGVAGVAPNAKVQPVRVLGCGGGYFSDLEAGITWASGGTVSGVSANATPARVINMSLSGPSATCPSTMQAAIDGAVARGTVVVVAAGNNAANISAYSPANCKNIITVAAVGRNGGRASYSNYGSGVKIAAPGGSGADSVISLYNTGTTSIGSDSYAGLQGTSMATPHVAGVVALMLSTHPELTPAKVTQRIQFTARPFPVACTNCGPGIVNAGAAVQP